MNSRTGMDVTRLRTVLLRLAPASNPFLEDLLPMMALSGITTPLLQAHFLAQIAVESATFTRTRESLNYSIEGLLDVFGRHRISSADALRLGRIPGRPADQAAIANCVYGGDWGRKNLGNTEPGDGARFIGRGLKQLTGRANYVRCDQALGLKAKLLSAPELLERPDLAAESAVWFWTDNKLNAVAATDNLEAVTRVVNGGSNGLGDRRAWLGKFKAALA